jgi:hypothetical protein
MQRQEGGDLRTFLDIAADLDLWRRARHRPLHELRLLPGARPAPVSRRGVARGALPLDAAPASARTQPCLVRRGRVAAASGRGQHAAGGGKGGRLFLVQGAAPGRTGGRNRRPGAPGGGRPSAGMRHGCRHGGSVAARVVARCWNWRWCCPPWSAGSIELAPGEPWCITPKLADETAGVGLIEAARGSLGHWLTVRRGRIHNYQIIAPTTWNFSPRDGGGHAGRAGTGAGGPAGERRGTTAGNDPPRRAQFRSLHGVYGALRPRAPPAAGRRAARRRSGIRRRRYSAAKFAGKRIPSPQNGRGG